MANVSTAMMSLFPRHIGTASAVLGAVTMAMGALASALVGYFSGTSLAPLTAIISLFTIASAVCYWSLVGRPTDYPDGPF